MLGNGKTHVTQELPRPSRAEMPGTVPPIFTSRHVPQTGPVAKMR